MRLPNPTDMNNSQQTCSPIPQESGEVDLDKAAELTLQTATNDLPLQSPSSKEFIAAVEKSINAPVFTVRLKLRK